MPDESHGFGVTQTLLRDGANYTLRTRQIAVEIIEGPDKGRTATFPGPEVRIGSGKGCDLLLPDTTVSRHHATLRIDAGGLRVLDERSRNHTILDGVQILEAYTRRGSVLILGKTSILVAPTNDTIDIPLSSRSRFGALLGGSVAMRRLFATLEKVSPTEATVLIEGETGCGKELVAEAVHEESPRADRPFVVFDCSAIAPSLLEAELFGHVKGSFTGALQDRAGALENADGGTLFLDEVGELPLDLQPKFLRALENRETRRIGGADSRKVNLRIVAATNRNLQAEVEAGRFREDLFYRLAVVRVHVPALRERLDDIPLLVTHFEKQLGSGHVGAHSITDAVLREFQTRRWPGNVRELRNAIEVVMATGNVERPASSTADNALAIDFRVPLKEAVERYERAYVVAALKKANGMVTVAADIAGINRKFIQRAIKRYQLRVDDDTE